MRNNLFVLMFGMVLMCGYSQENQNKFSYRIGDFEVNLLSWGQNRGDVSILVDATEEMIKECVPSGSYPSAINAFLIRTAEKTILVDAGFEEGLVANLHVYDVHAPDVDIILITHMHGDHIGGLLSNGEARFANATLYLPQQEYDYWTSDEAMSKVPEDKRKGFNTARRVVASYKDRIQLFNPGKLSESNSELLPGITPVAAFGHTPGHTMYLLESSGVKLLIWGDLVNAAAVQIPYPEVAAVYDLNPQQASSSRKEVLEYVAKNNVFVAGMHIAYPSIGAVREEKAGKYQFLPLQK
jgi:glyoxylase-like metal-dependent hydrolase (beta-lactamase superfamily II)